MATGTTTATRSIFAGYTATDPACSRVDLFDPNGQRIAALNDSPTSLERYGLIAKAYGLICARNTEAAAADFCLFGRSVAELACPCRTTSRA